VKPSDEVLRLVDHLAKDDTTHFNWRYGQAVFNYAYDLFKNETNTLRGSQIDCFQQDSLVKPFLDALDAEVQRSSTIVAAAIYHDGIVFTGYRHAGIIEDIVNLGLKGKGPILTQNYGFLTRGGKFLYREEAIEVAKQTGQIGQDFSDVLTSEDLW